MRISAAVLRRGGRQLDVEELELEPPRRDEVLVRPHASGICRSDLPMLDGKWPAPLPMVVGHEGAGTVSVGRARRPGPRRRARCAHLHTVLRALPLLPPGPGQPLHAGRALHGRRRPARRHRAALARRRAKELGFRAAKCEATFSGPYVHKGLQGDDAKVIEVVAAVREAVGPETTLMVDVQYAFDSVERAPRCCDALAELDVFFLETPLWVDDLAGYAELQRRSPVRIAQGSGFPRSTSSRT